MTMVMPSSGRVKERLEQALPIATIHQRLLASGHRFRIRRLSPGLSIHLWLLQLLAQVSLQGLRRLDPQTPTAAALCQARQGLPLDLFHALLGTLVDALTPLADAGCELFFGLRIVLLDATSLRTWDTPELAGHYAKHTNGRRITPGYPAPKLLCLMHAGTGLIRHAMDLPACRQEHMLLRRIAASLQPGQLLVADRGLVSFPFVCELLHAGAQACLRLPARMIAGGSSRGLRSPGMVLGEGDRMVRWTKTPAPTKAYSRRAYDQLPPFLTLRQITRQIMRDGFRPWTLTLVTTLVDAQTYPAQELVALYLKRWQIEVYFRDLKRTQGAAVLRSRSLAGAKKELLLQVMLYNLVRSLMAKAAATLKITADRISFIDTLRWLLYGTQDAIPPDLIVNPRRIRPAEPRRVKTRRSKHPPLNLPRTAYKSSQHPQALALGA